MGEQNDELLSSNCHDNGDDDDSPTAMTQFSLDLGAYFRVSFDFSMFRG